jgi:putative polyhydroxyalkanoate system protein
VLSENTGAPGGAAIVAIRSMLVPLTVLKPRDCKLLKIVREHTLGIAEARRRVDQLADELGAKLRLTHRWDGDHLRVSGSGVSGRIVVEETLVEVHVRTGLGMILLREAIREAIEGSIDQYIE